MFRPGIKADGIAWVIRSCGELFRQGRQFVLVIAGEGREKAPLKQLADAHLPDRVRFLGKLPRRQMYRFYSAGDMFVFPGIRESLGMVYLEAQSCGLPVVAFDNSGIPEVVQNNRTGFLVPLYDSGTLVNAMGRLLNDKQRRREMGRMACEYVRQHHDLDKNYRIMEKTLEKMVRIDGAKP
jgi:glycosyltransferase involved in cell wall biosynthesis